MADVKVISTTDGTYFEKTVKNLIEDGYEEKDTKIAIDKDGDTLFNCILIKPDSNVEYMERLRIGAENSFNLER